MMKYLVDIGSLAFKWRIVIKYDTQILMTKVIIEHVRTSRGEPFVEFATHKTREVLGDVDSVDVY